MSKHIILIEYKQEITFRTKNIKFILTILLTYILDNG